MSDKTWSDKGELICPYCGHHHKIDHTEGLKNHGIQFIDFEFACPKCGGIYLVSPSVTFTLQTFKIETK